MTDTARYAKRRKRPVKSLKIHNPLESPGLKDELLVKKTLIEALMTNDLEIFQDVLIAHFRTAPKSKLSSKVEVVCQTLRPELKDYLDIAATKPVRIQRRSGDSLILMSERHFAEIQNEILSLQRRLLGASQIATGAAKEYAPGNHSRLTRIKELRNEYDIKKMNLKPNPYVRTLTKAATGKSKQRAKKQ